MRPFTIYLSCKELLSAHQQQLIDIISGLVRTDIIYLLGASLYRRRSESVFYPEAPSSQHTSDYYLLVLLPDFEDKEQYKWQDEIEQRCSIVAPVTTIILKTATFQQWLSIHHPFATTVVGCAPAIYDPATINLTLPSDNVRSQDATMENFYRGAVTKAKEFIAGAELFKVRQQYTMSAFMLHQATEQALRAMLKMGTGYHSCTHNLDRLMRYASMVSYQLQDLFSGKTDKLLFKILQKAYSDARYSEDYSINLHELTALTNKVSRIITLLVDFEKNCAVLILSD